MYSMPRTWRTPFLATLFAGAVSCGGSTTGGSTTAPPATSANRHGEVNDPVGDTLTDSRVPVSPDLVHATADVAAGEHHLRHSACTRHVRSPVHTGGGFARYRSGWGDRHSTAGRPRGRLRNRPGREPESGHRHNGRRVCLRRWPRASIRSAQRRSALFRTACR